MDKRITKDYASIKWVGKRFGNLVVLNYQNGKFECLCDCGATVMKKTTYLTSGVVKTCGKCNYHKAAITTHGLSHDRIYRIWKGMNQRCYNPNSHGWPIYGARGIYICNQWRNDISSFREWALSNGYADNLSIDRIDGDKGYSPENCRWATAKEQANNQHPKNTFTPKKEMNKRSVIWTINGETKSALEWCKQYDFSFPFVSYRIKKMGMTPLEALTTPKFAQGRPTADSP